ncbi:MAG: hypothetical protein K2W95_15555 [Candidatus Obscuribacterales bacterium]|nr:hypothetical protein [Candidatus Obscuribacterales bacterium]
MSTVTEKPAIKTDDILNLLLKRYADDGRGEWLAYPEMRAGTGYSSSSNKYIDLWVLNCFNHQRTSYEIKVSRGDLLKELKDPKKRRMALFLSNYYYFIAPKDMIKVAEVPPECGLKEVGWGNNQKEIDAFLERCKSDTERGYRNSYYQTNEPPEFREFLEITTKISAPHRDSMPPTWNFLASFARRIAGKETERIKAAEDVCNVVDTIRKTQIFEPEATLHRALDAWKRQAGRL